MKFSDIKKEYILAAIIILALILRLYQWDNYAFAFYDEGVHAFFGVASSINPVMETLYQPPVLFLLEGAIYSIIHSVLVFRLLLIILSVISIILAYIWVKNDYSVNEALLIALFLATAPLHILHSRFLNQDSLLFCLGLGVLILVQTYSKKPKKAYLLLAGILLGIGAFTKFTFLMFNIIALAYALYLKKISLKKVSNIIIGESLIILLFMLPLIITWIKSSGSTYAITNFFSQYAAENVGESTITPLTTIFYIGRSFIFLGFSFILLVYTLLTNKNLDRKHLFLIYWIIYAILILSLSSKAMLRYLLMQNLAYIPIFLLAINALFSFNKKVWALFILLIIGLDSYYYYIFITNPVSIPEFSAFFIETKPFIETIAYLRQTMTVNDSIITNEPYLFIPMGLNIYSANYENHILCPNKNVKYLILINSSLGFDLFTYMNDVTRLSNYYSLDRNISNRETTFYIYNVTGNPACGPMIPPLKRGLYLKDII
ncbi:Dolichyl-phosphate-mannose-protein mannosyltransferase [Candidatus Tiddalikarchaeum anstoanum]|nr:Dolichyl-phosphate-mannose-protein mannosyltransferase [Candidatus Tiddalikarchaeum anstoanum]